MTLNGQEPSRILVEYDHQTQQVMQVKFDAAHFRNLEFVVAVLSMAQRALEAQIRVAQVASMRQQAAEQEQLAKLRDTMRR